MNPPGVAVNHIPLEPVSVCMMLPDCKSRTLEELANQQRGQARVCEKMKADIQRFSSSGQQHPHSPGSAATAKR